MDDCENQYEKVCQAEFAELHAKLDRLDEAIRGNGRPGIHLRLASLEAEANRRSRLFWVLVGALSTAGAGGLWRWVQGG